MYQQNITQNIKINLISVATPSISASNSATSYEISGTAVTLTCMSTSDSGGVGVYVWKFGGQIMYALLTLLAETYHLVKDITVNCHRSGAASQTYTVPNTDNSAAGDYTCMVTAYTISSSESSGYSLTVTGIVY